MFDVLSKGFKSARLKLQGRAELTEEALSPALREVRTSLIQADVEFGVARAFVERVKERSLGEIVPIKAPDGSELRVTPQDWFIKSCYDELVDLMGPVDTSLDLSGSPAVVMMVGLQGSGKTTTSGKLARKLVEEGKRPLLVAADIYRPAAIEQLQVLGRKLDVPVYSVPGAKPLQLATGAIEEARRTGRDVVIIDTAGRLAVDEPLMRELSEIKAAVNPANILFVVDAMIGQDAVRTAKTFHDRLEFTGFVLTKLDGDARGGAALSIKSITGKPVKFLGQGEQLDKLEEFRPEGLAQRILGFGDVVGLMKDFEKHVDQGAAMADAEKMLQGAFSYDDFVRQMQSLRKMGPIRELFARMPILSGMMDQIPAEAFDEREMDRTLAIIGSMTKQERRFPDLLEDSRFYRIAEGAGRQVEDVRELHARFLQAREMMKGLGTMMQDPNAIARAQAMLKKGAPKGGFPAMGDLGFPGLGGQFPASKPKERDLSLEEKLERRKKQLEARKARKKGK